MADHISLKVVTPEGTALDETVVFSRLQSTVGEMGVAPSHTPMLLTLKAGEFMLRDRKDEERFYFIPDGIAHITKTQVTLITPYLEEKQKIDSKRAEEAKKRAQDRLKKAEDALDRGRAQTALNRAEGRLKMLLSS